MREEDGDDEEEASVMATGWKLEKGSQEFQEKNIKIFISQVNSEEKL